MSSQPQPEIQKSTGIREVAPGKEQAMVERGENLKEADRMLARYRDRLKDLPQNFQDQLHDNVRHYFATSAERYDVDQDTNLSTQEFQKYQFDMAQKLESIIAQYAPTPEQLASREKQKVAAEKAAEQAREAQAIEIKDATFNKENLTTPDGLGIEMRKFDMQSDELRKEGVVVSESMTNFQNTLSAYEDGKKGWDVFMRGIQNTFGDDPETIAIKNQLMQLKNSVQFKVGALRAKKRAIAGYGGSLNQAGDDLRRQKIAERNQKFRDLDERGTEIQGTRQKNEEQYRLLGDQHRILTQQQEQMADYRENLVHQSQTADMAKEQITVGSDRLKTFDEHLGGALAQIDAALSRELPPGQRKKLEANRKKLLETHAQVKMGLGQTAEAEAMLGTTSEEIQSKQADTQMAQMQLDEYVTTIVSPSLITLEDSLVNLDLAKRKNGTQREYVEASYDEILVAVDAVDERIADSVLQNTLGNEQLIQTLEQEQSQLNSIEIGDGPNMWYATGGLLVSKIAEGVGYVVKDGLVDRVLDPLSRLMKDVTRDVPVLGTVTNIVVSVALDLPSGVLEGANEIIGGVAGMIAHPGDAVAGIASLIGRNAGSSWAAMGKAFVAVEDFEHGRIGKGLGKAALNILTTATGVGAAANGVKGASLAYRLSVAAGAGSIRAGARAGVIGIAEFAKEFGTGLAKIPGETLVVAGKILKSPLALRNAVRIRGAGGEFAELSVDVARAEREMGATSASIDRFGMGEITSMSADELANISAETLAELGIKTGSNIDRFVALRRLVARREKLIDARNVAQDKLVRAHNKASQRELVESMTEGLPRRERKLFAETYMDPMTGTLNREGLKFLEQSIASNERVSIASFDGDHFKALNNATSHKFGDSMIRLMGDNFHQLRRGLRQQGYDVHAVRMGGEEFVVFGNVPKGVLAKAMEEMAAQLKGDIRGSLTPSQMRAMRQEIYASKYSQHADGYKLAHNEIGGSTTGVSEISPEFSILVP